jgi:hypothetical protein
MLRDAEQLDREAEQFEKNLMELSPVRDKSKRSHWQPPTPSVYSTTSDTTATSGRINFARYLLKDHKALTSPLAPAKKAAQLDLLTGVEPKAVEAQKKVLKVEHSVLELEGKPKQQVVEKKKKPIHKKV